MCIGEASCCYGVDGDKGRVYRHRGYAGHPKKASPVRRLRFSTRRSSHLGQPCLSTFAADSACASAASWDVVMALATTLILARYRPSQISIGLPLAHLSA